MLEDVNELRERVRVRAYYIWVTEGCQFGLDAEYWRRAELLELGFSDRGREALHSPGISDAEFCACEVGQLKQSQTGVAFSSERNLAAWSDGGLLRHRRDGASESDLCAVESETDLMGKKKKDWRASVMNFLSGAKTATAETANVPTQTASTDVSSGTETPSEPTSMAEPKTPTSSSSPVAPLKSEVEVEAESTAENLSTGVANPVGAPPNAGMPSPPATNMSALADLRAEIAVSALFLHDFQSITTPYSIAKGMVAAFKTDEDGVEYLSLADGAVDAKSGGAPQGYTLKLPDEVERAASGNRIMVRAVARASGAGASRFALAYSTNEVGNSGWRWFTVGEGWSAFAYEYAVNPMIKGNGDFISVLAEPTGKPGVDVSCVSVGIVQKHVTN